VNNFAFEKISSKNDLVVGEMYRLIGGCADMYSQPYYLVIDNEPEPADFLESIPTHTVFQLIELVYIPNFFVYIPNFSYEKNPGFDMKILASNQSVGWITLTTTCAFREIVKVLPVISSKEEEEEK
jgi:hypothetical protein